MPALSTRPVDATNARGLGSIAAESIALLFVCYMLLHVLAQADFYKTDGPYLVRTLAGGSDAHPYHVLYPRMLLWLRGVLGDGWTAYQVALSLSGLGAACAVGVGHAAFRRTLPSRASAWVATSLFVSCPAVVFFGTVVELHAAFLPFAVAAFWVACEVSALRQRPVAAGLLGVLLGTLTHVAFLVHGTGLVLPGLVLSFAWFAVWRRGMDRGLITFAAAALVVHAALWRGGPQLWPEFYRFAARADQSIGRVFEGLGGTQSPVHLPKIFWREVVLPFFPLSLALGAVVWRGARFRSAAVGLWLGLLPYLVICQLLLAEEAEFGAYLLPAAWPLAFMMADSWRGWQRRRAAGLAVMLAGSLFVTAASWSAQADAGARFAGSWERGLRAECTARGVELEELFLMIGGTDEIGTLLARFPELQGHIPNRPDRATVEAGWPGMKAFYESLVAQGKTIVFTDGLRAWWAGANDGGEPLLFELINRSFGLERVERGAFRAWVLAGR